MGHECIYRIPQLHELVNEACSHEFGYYGTQSIIIEMSGTAKLAMPDITQYFSSNILTSQFGSRRICFYPIC